MKIYDLMPSIKELIPYDYEQIRSDDYDAIIADFFKNAEKEKTFEQISGSPGAGKTTFCKKFDNNFLSFDEIMENLPQYQKDLEEYGNEQAFKRNEITARIIGYEILRQAISNGYQLILEHSGVNDAHLELFENLHKLGYKTKVDFILCDIKIAINRAKIREKYTHRHTPEEMIRKRYSLIEQYIPQYEKIADEVDIYDTSENKYVLKSHFCRAL